MAHCLHSLIPVTGTPLVLTLAHHKLSAAMAHCSSLLSHSDASTAIDCCGAELLLWGSMLCTLQGLCFRTSRRPRLHHCGAASCTSTVRLPWPPCRLPWDLMWSFQDPFEREAFKHLFPNMTATQKVWTCLDSRPSLVKRQLGAATPSGCSGLHSSSVAAQCLGASWVGVGQYCPQAAGCSSAKDLGRQLPHAARQSMRVVCLQKTLQRSDLLTVAAHDNCLVTAGQPAAWIRLVHQQVDTVPVHQGLLIPAQDLPAALHAGGVATVRAWNFSCMRCAGTAAACRKPVPAKNLTGCGGSRHSVPAARLQHLSGAAGWCSVSKHQGRACPPAHSAAFTCSGMHMQAAASSH